MKQIAPQVWQITVQPQARAGQFVSLGNHFGIHPFSAHPVVPIGAIFFASVHFTQPRPGDQLSLF